MWSDDTITWVDCLFVGGIAVLCIISAIGRFL